MSRPKQTKGTCSFCQQEVTKGTSLKHVGACWNRLAAIEAAEAGPGAPDTLYYLRVQDAYVKAYWLDLEVRASAKLRDLDKYLRAIWLECCGHMSEFSRGGFGSRKAAMTRQIGDVFADGEEWTHIYDFGTSSETLVKAIAAREGKPTTKHPVVLLVRNVAPALTCLECLQPAHWYCEECRVEHELSGTLCEVHAKTHPHDGYGDPIRIVNSPRMGMCGYTGPADPPY